MLSVDHLKMKQRIEELLAGYKLQEAIELLRSLEIEAIPLRLRSDFAQLARRAHLYKEAIKILQDKIYGVSQVETKDILEYASSLRKLGMVHQCLELLKRAPSHKEKLLHEAYCYVHLWEYEKASYAFSGFLHQEGLTQRDVLVAKLNLIACFVYMGDGTAAMDLLHSIESHCRRDFHQFYLNCLELRGQIYLQQGEYQHAMNVLTEASVLAGKEKGTTTLFIEKWKLIAQASIQNTANLPHDFAVFKKRVRAQGHWETLRDVDYHLAKLTGNDALANYVYFGTPFDSFKRRVASSGAHLQKVFTWSQGSEIRHHLDPMDTRLEVVPFGLIQHRLLLVLLSDFYRPWSIARIFDSLFPNEIYDVDSSPKRIYALIKKIQDSLTQLQWPYELQSTVHGYRLRLKDGGSLSIYERMNFDSHEQILHYALLQKYRLPEFTPKILSQTLEVSAHKAYRWIHDLEAVGLAEHDKAQAKFCLKAS